MRHFMLALSSHDLAPTKMGDAVSWFRFYKLDADDEVYIPRLPGLEEIDVGDALWVALDTELLGFYTILRVEEDNINDRDELWFDSRSLTRALVGHTCRFGTGPLRTIDAAELLEPAEKA